MCWTLGLSFEGKSGNSRFGFHARAKDSTLERAPVCSEVRSSDGMLAQAWIASSQVFGTCRRMLERRDLRSSEGCVSRSSEHRAEIFNNQYFCIFIDCSSEGVYARATPLFWQARSSEELCLTLERASSGDFQHPALFAFLQTARARKSTLERPLCFGKLARA